VKSGWKKREGSFRRWEGSVFAEQEVRPEHRRRAAMKERKAIGREESLLLGFSGGSGQAGRMKEKGLKG